MRVCPQLGGSLDDCSTGQSRVQGRVALVDDAFGQNVMFRLALDEVAAERVGMQRFCSLIGAKV